ncbi:hypothetical protein M153_61750001244, partial [Pseudoloma neurophilia]
DENKRVTLDESNVYAANNLPLNIIGSVSIDVSFCELPKKLSKFLFEL